MDGFKMEELNCTVLHNYGFFCFWMYFNCFFLVGELLNGFKNYVHFIVLIALVVFLRAKNGIYMFLSNVLICCLGSLTIDSMLIFSLTWNSIFGLHSYETWAWEYLIHSPWVSTSLTSWVVPWRTGPVSFCSFDDLISLPRLCISAVLVWHQQE